MPDADDIDTLNDDIVSAAQKPASATIDGNTVVQIPLKDKIAAANHIAGTVAASKGHRGLRFTTLIPPGCG